MWRGHGRAVLASVALLLLLALASGCGGADNSGTGVASGTGTASGAGMASGPGAAAGAEPGTAAGADAGRDTGRSSFGIARPVSIDFDVPPGFHETQDYHVVVALFPGGVSRWVTTAGGGLDVIGVHSYLLDRDVSAATDEDLRALVDGFSRQVHAESASDPVKSTVAGHPAFTLTIRQPGAPGGGSFAYDTTYVFAGPYLVQVMCQYDRERTVIATGCAHVLATLRLALT